jgi:hypothetical protein
MNLDRITVTFEDGTKIALSSAFVGGILDDITGAPMGLYSGQINPHTAAVTLIQLLRAGLKMATEELDMDMPTARKLLDFCVNEAYETELKNHADDNHSINEHEIYLKMKKERRE